jgi:lipoprotein-releasing system permease protein
VRYEFFVGFRHLRSMRHQFLSTLTVLAIAGVALSVTGYTAVVSIAAGFVDVFRDRVLGVNPHIVVTRFGVHFSDHEALAQRLIDVPGVVSVSPFLIQEMLVMSDQSRARPGAMVRGMALDDLVDDPAWHAMVVDGDLRDLRLAVPPSTSGDEALRDGSIPVALGSVLADRLGVGAGDEIRVMSPLRGLRALSADSAREAAVHGRFRVAAVLTSGFFDYDNRVVVTDYRVLQALFDRGETVAGLELRIEQVLATGPVRAHLDELLPTGRFRVMDWTELNNNLFASLNLQKLALQIVMSSFVCVASLVIVCVLVMLVVEKRRDIAILRSMGATRGGILGIFVVEGMTIGIVGTGIGLLAGLLVCTLLLRIDFGLQYEVYRIDTLPVSIRPIEFVWAAVGALVLSFVATLFPALQASRVTPVEALKYD